VKTYRHAIIIDDDPDLCVLLKAILDDAIPMVRFAHSIESGKELLSAIKPDVIFLDNNLPDGQGINSIQAIKSISPNSLVVVITADDSKARAMAQGADIFIEKPLTTANIYNTLRAA
jgi:DNA-binding NtrC family response regulator